LRTEVVPFHAEIDIYGCTIRFIQFVCSTLLKEGRMYRLVVITVGFLLTGAAVAVADDSKAAQHQDNAKDKAGQGNTWSAMKEYNEALKEVAKPDPPERPTRPEPTPKTVK
jgi:hypothetical protein